MEEIAAHAGTSKSVFYRYFKDKAGLQAAVSDEAVALLERRLLASLEDSAAHSDTAPQPWQMLQRMVATYLHFAASSPQVYAFALAPAATDPVLREDPSGELHGFFGRIHAVLEQRVQDYLQRHGHSAGEHADLVALWPAAATGLVRSAGEAWLAAPHLRSRLDPDQMAEQITAWLIAGPLGTVPRRDADVVPPSDPSLHDSLVEIRRAHEPA